MENNQILDSNLFEQQNSNVDYELASTGKRFANYIIDLVIVYVLSVIAGVFYVITFQTTDISTFTSYLITIVIIVLYYTILEGINGKSIGKMITKTRVLNEDFSKPTMGTIFKRGLCRLIPLEQFSFLGDNGGWHDTITGTVVVQD